MKNTILLLSALTASAALSAQNLTTFGGDYVTANRTLQGNTADSIANNQFSPTIERQPTVEYNGPVFFAGMGIIGSPGISGGNTNVLEAGANDRIQFGLSGGETPRTLATVTMFNVSGWDSGNQQLEMSVFGMPSAGSNSYSSDEVRLVVRSGSDYFVSQTAGSFGAAGVGNITEVSIVSTTWLSYSPESSILGDFGVMPITSLASIDAVGVYLKVITQASGSESLRPAIQSLSVNAVVIPEPSTYAALIGLLALGFVALRRRFARAGA